MVLSAQFSKKFQGFNLDIKWTMGNELVVFFGPSGAGKSVTLKMISGLMSADEGSLYLHGEELFNSQTEKNVRVQERNIGYLLQNQSLFPHMSVKENIIFGANRRVKESELAEELDHFLSYFDIKGLEQKYPHEISGGQRQRVALAMNLIRRPRLLLLDEPFSALDDDLRVKMRRYLLDVRKRFNIPMILVTHDRNEAQAVADKIFNFKNGTISCSASGR